MTFREFLIAEAKFNKHAFKGGKAAIAPVAPQDQGGRMANQFQTDYSARVAYGKQMESKIILALQAAGWQIRPASESQDKYDKIDGFKLNGSVAVPFQIKYRDSGDDILMEVLKGDLPLQGVPHFNGRDIIGSAAMYVCLNKAGNLMRIRSAVEAKAMALKLAKMLVADYQRDNGNRVVTQPEGQARMTVDPATGQKKIMAFLSPHVFKQKLDLPIHNSLWAA